jgi:hypothetical protein
MYKYVGLLVKDNGLEVDYELTSCPKCTIGVDNITVELEGDYSMLRFGCRACNSFWKLEKMH